MGTGPIKQNALLGFILRYKFWIVSFIGIVAILELSLTYVNRYQQQSTWKSVASILRNEVNSSNSYQISRALSDMEAVGWIKCVKLTETSNDTRIFYDTTSQAYCGTFASKTRGELRAVNGATWDMSFASPENIWLHFLRFLLPVLVLLFQILLFRYLETQRQMQEAMRLRVQIEKDFLLDLTKQTKHDIASPIGALRIVVKRLDIPSEYSEMLGQIVERIDGIFNQLKNASNSDVLMANEYLESVSIEKIVNQIVMEKEKELNLEPHTIVPRVMPSLVVANKVELGRILSNVLNNAFEARKDGVSLKIEIDGQVTSADYLLTIRDNGKGISANNLQNIGKKGFSFGKIGSENMGLGVHGAIQAMSSFGGGFSITGAEGEGAVVTLKLKLSGSKKGE